MRVEAAHPVLVPATQTAATFVTALAKLTVGLLAQACRFQQVLTNSPRQLSHSLLGYSSFA